NAGQERRSLSDVQLDARTLASLDKVGYKEPTPIQSAFIPEAVTGRDCIGQAQTGTGKTAAFILPILQKISPNGLEPQALVLAPTRELAVQIEAEAKRLCEQHELRIASLCGGHPMGRQVNALM